MNTNSFDALVERLARLPVPAAAPEAVPPTRPSRAKRSEPVQWTMPGLCDGMRVTTSFGDLPVQALRRRDPLRTHAGTIATVAWVDCLRLDEEFLDANPDALPVRIAAGAFGGGRPERDLLVSPHQQVNASPTLYAQDFRHARDLTGRPGIGRQAVPMVNYYLFHCGAPAAVLAEGLCLRVSP